MNQITQEEKIDYIFNYIKTEKRNKIYKKLFKTLILFGLILSIKYLITNVGIDKIKENVSTQIGDIASPIVKKMVNDLENDNVDGIKSDLIIDIINENPELINKIKNNDN